MNGFLVGRMEIDALWDSLMEKMLKKYDFQAGPPDDGPVWSITTLTMLWSGRERRQV